MLESLYARSGFEFLVNTEATASQFQPQIAHVLTGSFVVFLSTSDTMLDYNSSAMMAEVFDTSWRETWVDCPSEQLSDFRSVSAFESAQPNYGQSCSEFSLIHRQKQFGPER